MITRGPARWLFAVALAAAAAPASAQTPPASPAPRSLGATVLLANENEHTVDQPLRDALGDPDPRIRMAAARTIAVVPHAELVNDLVGALARERDAAAAGELAQDLLYLGGVGALDIAMAQARRFGPAIAPAIAEWTGRMQPERLAELLPELTKLATPALDRLAAIVEMAQATHPAHRDALQRTWSGIASEPEWKDVLERRGRLYHGPGPTPAWSAGPAAPPPGARTMPILAPGVIADTLAAAGCKIGSAKFGVAALSYNPDGRPRRIEVDRYALAKPCTSAFTALARMAVADAEHPVGEEPQLLLLPLVRSFVDCSSEALPAIGLPGPRHAGPVTPPRKIKDVSPQYPVDAQKQRIQGLVVIRSILAPSGCVANARVIKSIPRLDWAALAAVSQWMFEPARIDGTPMPVVMTVTVNFTLR